jgi:hypothetical protein
MNEPVTKQDLNNQVALITTRFIKVESGLTNLGIVMDSNSYKVESKFTILQIETDTQFIKIRSEIASQFAEVFALLRKVQS